MSFLAKFLGSIPWWKLEPHPELVSEYAAPFCGAVPGSLYVLYLRYGGRLKVDLRPSGTTEGAIGMGLSASELAYIRESVSGLLPDTGNILQLTRTWNGVEWVEAWGTASGGTAVPCRLDYISGSTQMVGGAVSTYTGWVLTLEHTVTITESNRFQHGGQTYNVVSVDTDKSWIASVRCKLEQI